MYLIVTFYSYNPSGYLTDLLTRDSQQASINSFAYTHDGVGNRKAMTDLNGVHGYDYDKIYQLTGATHPNMPAEAFQYYPVGNRLNTSVDLDNALLEDNDYTYAHDRNGNLIEKVSNATGDKTVYFYDFENRLIKVESPGLIAHYKYDPFGRRIEKNVNGTITRYAYDGPNFLLEYDGENNIKSRYMHTLAIDDILSLEQGGKVYYYQKDGLGSIVSLTDQTGQVVQSYEYDGFGKIISQTGSIRNPFTYTGREYDAETGLYFYRARYYDPKAGRFLTKDPIGFAADDVNFYRITGNNPVRYRDPWGLWRKDVHSGIGIDTYGTFIWAKQVGFSEMAANIIAIANNATDDYAGWLIGVGSPARHFDTAVGKIDSRDSIASFELEVAIRFYNSGDRCEAYKALGRGLHSIQDKIAHGAWPFFLPHPEWFDDASLRPNELLITERPTKDYLKTFLREIVQ